LELHPGAGSESKSLALFLQGFDEAGILQRHCPQLVQHRLHLRHGFAGRAADLLQGLPGARLVAVESR
jgi:hypothetical protein